MLNADKIVAKIDAFITAVTSKERLYHKHALIESAGHLKSAVISDNMPEVIEKIQRLDNAVESFAHSHRDLRLAVNAMLM